jgi:hypothetical protein
VGATRDHPSRAPPEPGTTLTPGTTLIQGSGFLPLSGVARPAHHGPMRFILAAVGLIVAGVLAVWLIKAVIGFVLSIIFYVVAGVLLVAGAMYIYGKAKRSISGDNRRRLPY